MVTGNLKGIKWIPRPFHIYIEFNDLFQFSDPEHESLAADRHKYNLNPPPYIGYVLALIMSYFFD